MNGLYTVRIPVIKRLWLYDITLIPCILCLASYYGNQLASYSVAMVTVSSKNYPGRYN